MTTDSKLNAFVSCFWEKVSYRLEFSKSVGTEIIAITFGIAVNSRAGDEALLIQERSDEHWPVLHGAKDIILRVSRIGSK